MSSKTVVSQLIFGLSAGLCFSNAQAAFIIDNENGLSSPDKIVIDFGNNLYPVGTTIDNQFPGVTFGPTYVYSNTPSQDENYPALTDGYLGNQLDDQGSSSISPGSILFDTDVTAAVFSWRARPNTTFSAWNDGVFVADFAPEPFPTNTALPFDSGRYYGFSDLLFDEIRLSLGHPTKFFTLDNLEYVPAIPVPPALWLFASGLIGLAGLARRKR